ncbi:MAG TPA: cation transporter [Croceicoccus sp.]|nr:cation transporter [Croceicoccus sp.]
MSGLPVAIRADMARARRLEWGTLAAMSTVVAAMYFTMGSSKAMQSALIEDVLSLVPAITWLICARIEPRPANDRWPFGRAGVMSLAFLIAAVALMMVGLFLVYESVTTLVLREHPTVPPVTIFGQQVWMGWLMIAALAYSVGPPMVMGRIKQPVARRLRDKVLHTDALMQKADWQTGLAGILGVLGIGMGLWWADSLAALFIGASVLKDGVANTRIAAAELLDGAPRELESDEIAEEAKALKARLEAMFPGGSARMRENGRYIEAMVEGVPGPDSLPPLDTLTGPDMPGWRLASLSFSPPRPDEGPED